MKRIFIILLSFTLLLSICACGNEGKDVKVVGQWDRDFSIVDYEPEDDIHSGWVFDKRTEKHDDGKMYGNAYYLLYGGDVDISNYDYYLYCINDDNTITIINYYYSLFEGWDIDVYDTLEIKIINGKRALVSKEYENEVYYYSGDGKDILDLFDEE